ncbi:hypothetical protein N9Z13_07260 [Luminiphilus sp.]|nr:hypothetical protein [Luminiphilus sp.]
MTETTTVQTVDLWSAIDALDALPGTHNTEWYMRLVEAAEAATQADDTGVVSAEQEVDHGGQYAGLITSHGTGVGGGTGR